ncbi:hypothetical protein Gogos_019304 [Gossypium gossypioides]|uniref:Uncharacterized protein n=1 Tax=Gossypium gossypioides TaxID=34282 RepID=A0A7J9BGZ3_GOSGO|nr:hypothetical protein [Gossypium gossypioides]
MFPSDLKSRGSNTFVVQNIFPYGTIEVKHPNYDTFKVNSLRLKLYFGGNTDKEREELQL